MQFAHKPMGKIPGIEFYKLLGTGKAQFNPRPDWSVYVVLQVWENEDFARDYFLKNLLFEKYKKVAKEHWVVFCKNRISRGEWDGGNPFQRSKTIDKEIPYVLALTRATIKTRLLRTFWKFVPKSQTHLWDNKGLLYTKGVGEVPFKQMATLSIWKDEKSLNQFAYQGKGHVSAIGKTRDLDWYHEELFARFQPFKTLGVWNGEQLMPELHATGNSIK